MHYVEDSTLLKNLLIWRCSMSRERIINQTKQLLKASLMELLADKPLAKITVKELCEKADINRTTYYKYYRI